MVARGFAHGARAYRLACRVACVCGVAIGTLGHGAGAIRVNAGVVLDIGNIALHRPRGRRPSQLATAAVQATSQDRSARHARRRAAFERKRFGTCEASLAKKARHAPCRHELTDWHAVLSPLVVKPLAHLATVQEPSASSGVYSWTLATLHCKGQVPDTHSQLTKPHF